ncbi:MAG: hypothetical protein OXH96_14980, partial [Spirochaetaceae bacterium]|nr:hypothetical protein [Spirochaetaceae bacterium]
LGAACTAALATDRRRRGADRACVAVADAFGTAVSTLTFAAPADAGGEPAGAADAADRGAESRRAAVRQRQEAAASAMLVAGLASACGVDAGDVAEQFRASPGADVRREFHPSESFAALESGRCRQVMLNAAAQVVTTPVDWRRRALLSGSYHPLHAGHVALGKAAASFLGREVVYELPLANADKAPIALPEARRRAAQFAARAPVVMTRAALFADKAALFPGAVFVVGADTAERLVDERFYGGSAHDMDAALAALAEHGCRLLVAGRRSGGERYLTLRDLAPRIPAAHRGLFCELPEALFRRDISSTEVRSRAAARPACR